MRSAPDDLTADRIVQELVERWLVQASSIDYVPEGGGSHHWRVVSTEGRAYFVTVDDLDNKTWLGEDRESVSAGVRQAYATTDTLRHAAGLSFVLSPLAAHSGELLHRLSDRYTVSVFTYVDGHSFPFGPYRESGLRARAIELIATLHQATPAVRERAPVHKLGYSGRQDLTAFLTEPNCPWVGGPFSDSARELFVAHSADLTELVDRFNQLALSTAPARADTVITHGEPHPANLMEVGEQLFLIDWDTAGLAAPERDVALIAPEPGPDTDRYQVATGHEVNFAVVDLYRLRWYLDDVGSAVRMFRRPHAATEDTRRWWNALGPQLAELPNWLDRLS